MRFCGERGLLRGLSNELIWIVALSSPAWGGDGGGHEVPYDQLVLAMGAVTNTRQIPGSELAMPFKTLADVIVLRNHLIECLERADVETDPAMRRRLLTMAVVGGGFVGSEVFGELTAFMDEIVRYYRACQPG